MLWKGVLWKKLLWKGVFGVCGRECSWAVEESTWGLWKESELVSKAHARSSGRERWCVRAVEGARAQLAAEIPADEVPEGRVARRERYVQAQRVRVGVLVEGRELERDDALMLLRR